MKNIILISLIFPAFLAVGAAPRPVFADSGGENTPQSGFSQEENVYAAAMRTAYATVRSALPELRQELRQSIAGIEPYEVSMLAGSRFEQKIIAVALACQPCCRTRAPAAMQWLDVRHAELCGLAMRCQYMGNSLHIQRCGYYTPWPGIYIYMLRQRDLDELDALLDKVEKILNEAEGELDALMVKLGDERGKEGEAPAVEAVGKTDALIDLSGTWRAGGYTAKIDGSGKSYHYVGQNGDNPQVHYKHEAFLSWSGLQGKQEYDGKAKDVSGWCCGNSGHIWMEVVDADTIHSWSQWFKPNQKEPFMKGDVTLTRERSRPAPGQVVGNCREVTGEVTITRGERTFKAASGTAIQYNDWIETGREGRVSVVFDVGRTLGQDHVTSHLSLAPNTHFCAESHVDTLSKRGEKGLLERIVFHLARGRLRSVTEKLFGAGSRIRFRCSSCGGGIRGTDFICEADPARQRDVVAVREGSVEVSGDRAGAAVIQAGQQVEVRNGAVRAPTPLADAAWKRMSVDLLAPAPGRDRVSLGAQVRAPSRAEALDSGLKQLHGVKVLQVAPGSPAERAGLKPGDIVLDFAGRPILTVTDLSAAVQQTESGATVPLTVWRRGTQKRMAVPFTPLSIIPPQSEGSCRLVVTGALDDHYTSDSLYYMSITVNGKILFAGEAGKVFEHGRPHGQRFGNWNTLVLDLPGNVQRGQSLSVQFRHTGSQKHEWIAVDCLELVCGAERRRYEIGGFTNYGARDGAAGIIYGQGSNGWTIQR